MLEEPVGPVLLLHVIPDTPAIDQVAVPEGVTPPVGPETVAVNVNVEPSATVGELVVTPTAGVNFDTLRLYAVLGPAGK
jgi:hypothetical protein